MCKYCADDHPQWSALVEAESRGGYEDVSAYIAEGSLIVSGNPQNGPGYANSIKLVCCPMCRREFDN